MSDQSIVEVSQADRDAAAEYVTIAFGERYRKSVLNEGRWPDLVQAFARHRIAEREACAKVAENACYNPPTDREMEVWNEAGDHIAAAIRARSSNEGRD